MGGKREIWKSLHTSDLDEAKLLSVRQGQETERQFQALKRQAERAQTDPHAFARQYEARAVSEDAELWRSQDLKAAAEDDGTFESARQISETLDAQLDAVRSAIEKHRASLRLQDTKIVSALLDEVLQEQGLHVPSQRRREFALALLKAHTRVLEKSLKRGQSDEIVSDGAQKQVWAQRRTGHPAGGKAGPRVLAGRLSDYFSKFSELLTYSLTHVCRKSSPPKARRPGI